MPAEQGERHLGRRDGDNAHSDVNAQTGDLRCVVDAQGFDPYYDAVSE